MSSKRTYSSKRKREAAFPPSSPTSTLASSPAPTPSLHRRLFEADSPSSKRPKKEIKKTKAVVQKKLTQLHLCIDQPVVRRCPLCELTYTKGAEEDENLHRAHCARVQRSMDWGKDEAREAGKAGVEEVATDVTLKGGEKGKIICIRAAVGGKIGAKLSTILEVVGLTLSSPPLEPKVLQKSKAYLFLLPTSSSKHQVVGCVIAQRITTAMAIAEAASSPKDLVSLDAGLFCYPEPLATPLGIARLFVGKNHRRKGIATKLLDTVAKTFIQGCVLDPKEGQVAFTQTTGDGLAIMRSWGGQGMRIYEE